MNRKQLKKNRLDLEYRGEAQKINAFLILLTTGILGFLGTFIWLAGKNLFYIGVVITLIVSIMGIFYYKRSSQRMKEILNEIENLE